MSQNPESSGNTPYFFTNNKRPDIAVQIVNYRTADYLNTCLDTLLADVRGGPRVEVYVTDNASGDDLSALEKKYTGEKIHFSQLPDNIGFGHAHNILAEASKSTDSPTILILNPDIQFYEPATLERLQNRIATAEKIKVVGPKLVDTSGHPQLYDHGDYLFNVTIGKKQIKPYLFPLAPFKHDTKPTEVPWVSGAVFIVQRAAFEKAQGFDPNIFLYFEEVDLSQRLINDGGAIIYDPTIHVQHVGSVSTKDSKQRYFIQSFDYVVGKHHSRLGAKLLKAFYHRVPPSAF